MPASSRREFVLAGVAALVGTGCGGEESLGAGLGTGAPAARYLCGAGARRADLPRTAPSAALGRRLRLTVEGGRLKAVVATGV